MILALGGVYTTSWMIHYQLIECMAENIVMKMPDNSCGRHWTGYFFDMVAIGSVLVLDIVGILGHQPATTGDGQYNNNENPCLRRN